MHEIQPFRIFCQKVLPLVYDESLSYYELLCKVVEYLNSAIDQVNLNSELVAELYNYVQNYFDSADFRQLVNDKLDEMAENGVLYDLLEAIINNNLELSNNESETVIVTDSLGDAQQATIRGTLDGAYVADVNNYYLTKAPVIAKKDARLTAGQEKRRFGILNADGTYLYPYDNGNQLAASGGDPMGSLLCMTSFIKQGIIYGRRYGMFNTDAEQTQFSRLVCSDYVACGLRGITFNNSKCGGCGDNFETVYKSRTFKTNISQMAPEPKDTLITREMAYIFAAYGSLYELDYDNYSNLSIGDVIFFAYEPSTGENYLAIHHCGTVLDIDYTQRRITVLECGQPTETAMFDYSYSRHTDETCVSGWTGQDDEEGNPISSYPIWKADHTYTTEEIIEGVPTTVTHNGYQDGDRVRYPDLKGCIYQSTRDDNTFTPTDRSWTDLADAPGVDCLYVTRETVKGTGGTIKRYLFVAKPAWPNVHPTLVRSETFENIETTNTDGGSNYGVIKAFGKSTWNYRKGDICVLKFSSDINKLNPTGQLPYREIPGDNTSPLIDTGVYLRITGVRDASNGEGGTTEVSDALWRSVPRSRWYDVPNDRIIYFVIDRDDYKRLNFLFRYKDESTINSNVTLEIYRL